MFTNEELTTIAGQLRASANETLRRCPEHTFAERLLEIAAKAEDAVIDNTPFKTKDSEADYVSFIDSRNLIELNEESRDKYIAQRDASALRRHETALKYDYPGTHERLYGN
jgi:hypothetical protein